MSTREDAEAGVAWSEAGRREGQGVMVAGGEAARCIPPWMSSRAVALARLQFDAGEEWLEGGPGVPGIQDKRRRRGGEERERGGVHGTSACCRCRLNQHSVN